MAVGNAQQAKRALVKVLLVVADMHMCGDGRGESEGNREREEEKESRERKRD